jgi:hypothetical protein
VLLGSQTYYLMTVKLPYVPPLSSRFDLPTIAVVKQATCYLSLRANFLCAGLGLPSVRLGKLDCYATSSVYLCLKDN